MNRNKSNNDQATRSPPPLPPQRSNIASQRTYYTGVDKLILAAMMEDSAAAAAAMTQVHGTHPPLPPSGYMPIGRGIGYFSMRDVAMEVPTPSNKSELELYRLLEKANLLSYFGTFLNFGGDDVQQLSDADEDEFLEIMSLVGMTQKPLHVRRLQKALIEWRENKEMDSCFKRPHSNITSSQRDLNNIQHNDNSRRQPSPDPSILVESPATTPNSIKSMTTVVTPDSKNAATQSQQQYALPHEILVGAPKRPRLMDNILANSPRSSSKGLNFLKSSDEKQDQVWE